MMKEFKEINGYDQMIETEKGEIIKYSCTCKDFQFRRLKKIGEGPDTKTIVTGPCKHIKEIINVNRKQEKKD